jgi:hypothetical protein
VLNKKSIVVVCVDKYPSKIEEYAILDVIDYFIAF